MDKKWWHLFSCQRCATRGDETRQQILESAFEEIHRRGFQAASIQNILKHTGVTKGALYHHFPGKLDLGYAVVDEIVRAYVDGIWMQPLAQADDPLAEMKEILQQSGEQMTGEDISLGCPLNNLAQEMSPIDAGFRKRLESIYRDWRTAIANAVKRGMKNGSVRADADPEQISLLFIAMLEGCLSLAKNTQNPDVLYQCGGGIMDYLDRLRPVNNKTGKGVKKQNA